MSSIRMPCASIRHARMPRYEDTARRYTAPASPPSPPLRPAGKRATQRGQQNKKHQTDPISPQPFYISILHSILPPATVSPPKNPTQPNSPNGYTKQTQFPPPATTQSPPPATTQSPQPPVARHRPVTQETQPSPNRRKSNYQTDPIPPLHEISRRTNQQHKPEPPSGDCHSYSPPHSINNGQPALAAKMS